MCNKTLNYTDIPPYSQAEQSSWIVNNNASETPEEREQLDRGFSEIPGLLEGLTEAEVADIRERVGLTEAEVADIRERALTDIRRRAAANAEIEREVNAEMAEIWRQNRRPSRISRVITALFRRARGKRRKKTRRRKNPKKK